MKFQGHLTVKRTAFRYLDDNVDRTSALLVFLWGKFGAEASPHWLVSISPRSSLPRKAREQGFFGKLKGIPFLIVQPEHAPKLDGCTLVYEGGTLAIKPSAASLPGKWIERQLPTGEYLTLA